MASHNRTYVARPPLVLSAQRLGERQEQQHSTRFVSNLERVVGNILALAARASSVISTVSRPDPECFKIPLAQPIGIGLTDLRDLNDLAGDQFGYRVIPVS